MKPIIFLDIDGVLNDHAFNDEADSSTLLPSCVAELNRILRETDARIVLISAWRYMHLNGAITLSGLDYLLRTHGVIKGRLVGTTRLDWDTEDKDERFFQIMTWVKTNVFDYVSLRYIVVDNDDLGYSNRIPYEFIKINGSIGLTRENADTAIAVLKGDKRPSRW